MVMHLKWIIYESYVSGFIKPEDANIKFHLGQLNSCAPLDIFHIYLMLWDTFMLLTYNIFYELHRRPPFSLSDPLVLHWHSLHLPGGLRSYNETSAINIGGQTLTNTDECVLGLDVLTTRGYGAPTHWFVRLHLLLDEAPPIVGLLVSALMR